ncbi:MAG: ABC transporter permease [Dehalococcoidia bacterium]|nr:MAG: ABC transporter permease [Dehalococcoidia bacterium]
MNLRVIRALLKKDAALFTSNRFYLLITVIGIIFYIGVYFILPAQLDEEFSLGMYAPVVPPAFTELTEREGVNIEYFNTEELLRQAVLDGDYQTGIALPLDIVDTWASGGKPEITVYYVSTAPPEVSSAIVLLVQELAYNQTGQALNFDTTEEILGQDLLGNQIALRDRMRPLLAIFILLVEILTLASLIAIEIEQGTARALLVTPMRTSELFMAKGLLGVGLAFGQAVLFMGLVGGFSHQPLIVFLALLIGSVMVVGIGFLVASLARDVMAVTGWGMLILIILAVPGFGVVIPGLISDWARVIPSYYLTDTVNRVINYGVGWGDVGPNLGILTGISALVIWAGMVTLRRRYR